MNYFEKLLECLLGLSALYMLSTLLGASTFGQNLARTAVSAAPTLPGAAVKV